MLINHSSKSRSQRGSALPVSLIMLLILTMVGIQVLKTVSLEEKMAGNSRDQYKAFEAAEAAIRVAEDWLLNQNEPVIPTSSGTNNVWLKDSADTNNADWWNSNGTVVSTAIASLSIDPKYVIEELHVSTGGSVETGSLTPTPTKYFYRITAHGVGGASSSSVLVQTIYAQDFQ